MLKNKRLSLFIIIFNTIGFILVGYSLLKSENPAPEKDLLKTELSKKQTDDFGIYADSFNVSEGTVKPNETISSIFYQAGVPDSIVYTLQKKFKDIFNFRKIVAGKHFRIYTSKDSLNKLKNFVYKINPINFIRIDLNDPLNVSSGRRKIKTVRKEVSGIIEYSLYTALERNEADPELFAELSDIFAWQVDFYHIQKGDNFKVIYEENYVGNKPVGIAQVIGAFFNYRGEDYYAIGFNKDGRIEYFDENGKSLRKAFLKAPLKYSRISSRYSHRRFHPILKRYKPHLGIDYAAPTGTPVRSVADGIITASTYTRGNGNYVKIRHNSVYSTQYLHLSRFAKGMRKGSSVRQGQIIGYVGSTGLATGPHLCYRFWKNGVQVNPLKVKMPPSKSIDDKYQKEYDKLKDKVISELNRIDFKDTAHTEVALGF
jgi:murein DD-endopeptidase MepM/ murein hydrolase activator NlpD